MNTKSIAFPLFAVAIAILGASSSAQAPDASMYLGSVKLTVGETEQAVIAKLADKYNLQRLQADAMGTVWSVDPKGSGPTLPTLGSVTFSDGQLTDIQRHWGPADQQKGVAFARALHSAVKAVTQDRVQKCDVAADQSADPEVEVASISMACGVKSIRITILRHTHGESAFVDESLSAARTKPESSK